MAIPIKEISGDSGEVKVFKSREEAGYDVSSLECYHLGGVSQDKWSVTVVKPNADEHGNYPQQTIELNGADMYVYKPNAVTLLNILIVGTVSYAPLLCLTLVQYPAPFRTERMDEYCIYAINISPRILSTFHPATRPSTPDIRLLCAFWSHDPLNWPN